MRKSIQRSALVVGLGRFGSSAATRLTNLGWDVVGVDKDPAIVAAMQEQLGHVVELDASDEEALSTIDIAGFEVCIVSRGESIESSILLVLNLQTLGAKKVVAKATSEHHARILRRLGVTDGDIIFPELDAGKRLAEHLQAPHLTWWTKLAEGRLLGIVKIPQGRAGCPLDLWQAAKRPSLQLLAHLCAEGNPQPIEMHAPLRAGELLLVSGSPEDLLALGQ